MSGYSKTPLVKKLGIKEGHRIKLVNEPADYLETFVELPEGVKISDRQLDFVHIFTNELHELESLLNKYLKKIVSNGMIWVSWHKKSSGKQDEVNEDAIRDTAIALGMVDIKVCSIDRDWSGLKLVIRKINR